MRGLAGRADVSRCAVSKVRAHSPRRVVLRRDGRTRTPGAQCWRLPFWPLNYVPMKLKTARQVIPGGGAFAVAVKLLHWHHRSGRLVFAQHRRASREAVLLDTR